jgi:hypothetical protein
MKGSCQAITAYGAAETFAQAEKVLMSGTPLKGELPDVLALVAELEAELNALIAQHDIAAS